KREGLNGVNYLTPYPILRRYSLMGLEDDKKKMFIQEIIGEMKEHEIEGLYYYLNLGFMASGIGDEDTSYDMIPFLSHEALGGIMIDERLDVLERLKDSIHSEERLASTLHQIGMVYQSKGDYKKAFSYYKEALEIFKRYNDIKFTMTAYNNIIDALLKDKRLEDAEGYIIDALSMEKQLLHLSPGIVIPNTLRTLRFAMEIKDRAKDKTTIEGLLSSQDFKILIDSLKEDSGI
ncbi:MAG: tetratricopeptide repeat protein, partial [Nitrospinae bacterium]|nr:tetratricopeptide repeat protein [Nitrospinota bacterium]